jgi:hypothetical protein
MRCRVAHAPSHDEELADHAAAFADVLLHQLGARDADEGAVRVVRHGARKQRLARAWRAVQQHALGLRDAQRVEQLRVLDRQLHHLLDLLDLRPGEKRRVSAGSWRGACAALTPRRGRAGKRTRTRACWSRPPTMS